MMQYLINLFFAIDQFVSTVLGGHPDDTVSQRLGRAKASGGGALVLVAAKTLDMVIYVLFGEANHCDRSLVGKSSAREIWNWGGDRSQIKVVD